MSATGPNVYVTIGDTAWWDLSDANVGAGYRVDSRLLGALRANTSTPTLEGVISG